MPKQPKRQKCTSCSVGWCQNHLFELKPNSTSLYFRKIQRVRLCPRLNKTKNNFQKMTPLLNKDKKYYTPTFILQQEQSFYSQNDQKMLKNHQQKIQDMVQGNTCTIWIAKHGRKRKYCTVCHSQYDDYLEHIKENSHKEKVNKNKYTGYIKQMAAHYHKLKKVIPKVYPIQQSSDVPDKTTLQNSIISQNERLKSLNSIDLQEFQPIIMN